MKANTRLALKLFGLFWVGFFVLGFLLGRYHYQADGAVSPLIYRTMSYEMHGETGGGQIEFSCPGSGTLFRYVLDERKLIPDEISISYFVDRRMPTISSIQVPKVDISIASGVFGALGVGPLFKIFTGGGDIKVQEGIIVALAFLSSG